MLPLTALSFRRGWLFSLVLLSATGMLVPIQQVHAAEWQSLWLRRDQQGAEAFANEDHATAAALFNSTQWQAASSYRAGNYEAAIAAFSASDTSDGHYNRGNSLALMGNYAEAIAAYELAINLENDHADAIANKEIVEQLLEQQESEEGEEQDGDSQENQSEQNSDNESEQNQENSDQQDQESQEGNQDQQEEQQQNQPPDDQESS